MDSIKKEPPWKDEGSNILTRDCGPREPLFTATNSLPYSSYLGNSGLLSKDCVDRVESINDKPSVEAEGDVKLRDATPEATKDCDSHIVAHGRFSRKQEIPMSEKIEINYSKRPNALSKHPAYISAKLKHKFIFLELLSRMTYSETFHNVKGTQVLLRKYQYCKSYSRLAEELSYESDRKEDRVSVNDIRGFLRHFEGHGLITQDLTHSRSIITIVYSEICEEKEISTHTGAHIALTQHSHTKEAIKDEEDDLRRRIAIRSDLSDKGSEEGIAIAERSPLLNAGKGKKRKFTSEDLRMLKEVCIPTWNISEKSMRIWLTKFDLIFIFAQLDVLRQRGSVDNAEKWLERAFKMDYAGTFDNIEKNRDFAIRFKDKNRWDRLKILKQYCNLEIDGGAVEDLQMRLDPALFQEMIIRKFENYGNRNE